MSFFACTVIVAMMVSCSFSPETVHVGVWMHTERAKGTMFCFASAVIVAISCFEASLWISGQIVRPFSHTALKLLFPYWRCSGHT